jgi:uncharacterized protein (TIGR02246 family)
MIKLTIINWEGKTMLEKLNKTMQEIASRNFAIWNHALQSRNPKEVGSLYIADATFLPTTSEEFKKGQYGAEEYFKHFLIKNPTGKIIQEKVQTLETGCYLHSGMYNFEMGPDDDRQVIEARFSFVWKKDDQGEWKIVHHHSSVKPRDKK